MSKFLGFCVPVSIPSPIVAVPVELWDGIKSLALLLLCGDSLSLTLRIPMASRGPSVPTSQSPALPDP